MPHLSRGYFVQVWPTEYLRLNLYRALPPGNGLHGREAKTTCLCDCHWRSSVGKRANPTRFSSSFYRFGNWFLKKTIVLKPDFYGKHIVTCNFQVSKTNQQKTLLDWIWRFLWAATTQYCQGSFAKKIRLIIIKILSRYCSTKLSSIAENLDSTSLISIISVSITILWIIIRK